MFQIAGGIISSNRGNIPVTVYAPLQPGPLVMLVHGFKSDSSEDGRYDDLAAALVQKGSHVIMMDLPGCGLSQETLLDFSLSNCLDDVESCLNHMLNKYPVDRNRISLVGYSLGGRIISLFLNRYPNIDSLVFWAGCNQPFGENDHFLQQDLSVLRKQASEKGYCDFHDIFTGVTDRFPGQFIEEMIELDALKPLQKFTGRALIIQGDRDDVIDNRSADMIYDSLVSAKERRKEIIEGADHLFGLYDGRKLDSEKIIQLTVDFLAR